MGDAGLPAFERSDRVIAFLAQTDDDYHFLTWSDVKTIISTNC